MFASERPAHKIVFATHPSRERLMCSSIFPRKLRVNALLLRENGIDKLNEDLLFERCQVPLDGVMVPAWIARTSRNFHGDHVLEIMAADRLRQRYGSKDNDYIYLQVFAAAVPSRNPSTP